MLLLINVMIVLKSIFGDLSLINLCLQHRCILMAIKSGERYTWQETVVDFATSIAKFLDAFGRWREREGMMAKVESRMSKVQSQEAGGGKLTKAEFMMLDRQGDTLLQQGRAREAERLFRDLLARLEAGAAYGGEEAIYDQGTTLMRLGRCLAAQGRPQQAVAWHRRAVEGFGRISESSKSAKTMLAAGHVDWADNLTAMGQFDEAQGHYETALPILQEIDDRRSVGATLGQLGLLALRRDDLKTAAARYTEALETFRALGEPQVEAVVWHQLGRVAQTAAERRSGDWEEAERYYREAVRIREHIHDLPELAKSYNQLARVAQGVGRLADAERWYLRAQELKDQVAPQDDSTLHNLTNLYLTQGRLDEAESYARRALAIVETLDLSAEPWKNYAILAQIAEARGRADEAASWRRKANESRDAFAGTQHQVGRILQQFQQVIAGVVAACNGNAEAKTQVEALFDTFRRGNWQIVDAIQRIWAGERDADALTATIDYNSRAIVLAILAQLSPQRAPGVAEQRTHRLQPVSPALPEWAPDFIAAVAAAAQGHPQAIEAVNTILPQLEQANWHALCDAARHILAGEHDFAALQPGLDPEDAAIVQAILARLSGAPAPPSSPPGSGRSPTAPAQEEGLTLDQLFNLVAAACGPEAPAGLGEQLFGLTGQLARDAQMPAEIRALGRVLNGILAGERAPDLSALSPELAQAVEQLLEHIETPQT